MIRQCLKILGLLVIAWAVTLFTIYKEFIYNNKSFLNDENLFENSLDKFQIRKQRTNGRFTDWNKVGRSSPHLSYNDRLKAIKINEHPIGSLGKPVYMADSIQGTLSMIIKKGWQENAFNQFISDLIPIDRTLPDLRDKWCLQRNSSKTLPEVSVVICFFNEAWSTLLRTLHSVLNRSPPHLLREVLLIDDFSDRDDIKTDLKNYILKLPKVILMRTSQREGLIRARIIGVKKAKSPVVVFLDSHCECTDGWLEPLLERIVENRKIVASPVIDHIDPNTFEYIYQDPKNIQIGGFIWKLNFIWRSIPKYYKRENVLLPIKTPTIAGGLFAIDKEFFYDIGYYDEGFDIWGGENLELSFKVWMCGGSLEIIPCSHVGHIFRNNFPYYNSGETFKRNTVRLAEVWLDDYAKFFYERIGNVKGDFGDVTSRKELRKKLKCKSFNWYLHNVYSDIRIPKNNVASGQIYSTGNNAVCLDASATPPQVTGSVNVMACHGQGGNQFWEYTRSGKIRYDDFCLDFLFGLISLFFCRDNAVTQIWLYETKTKFIRHKHTQQCLKFIVDKNESTLQLTKCYNERNQLWDMENYNIENLDSDLQLYAKRRS